MKCSCEDFQHSYPDCTFCSRGKQISVQEKKRKYILQNPLEQKVCRVRIDGCVIQSQAQAKCDYLITVCKPEDNNAQSDISSSGDVYFVELKGKDIIRAVEQLTETIKYFQSGITGKAFARAVVSKVTVPRAGIETDARVKYLKKILEKKFNGNFNYRSQQYIESLIHD